MKVLIIGGGMSGLTYGIMSAKNGIETVICERNSRVGKKISATGNGKCNIGNANVSTDCFNNSKIVQEVLQSVPLQLYEKFLNSCGVYTFTDSVGRMYPLSESASNVVDCLRHTFLKYGKIVCDCQISSLRKVNCGFEVKIDGSLHRFDKVVLACGSGSGTNAPEVWQIVDKKYFTKLVPSLVPVKISQMDKQLNGLRAKSVVTLLQDGTPIAVEKGEVQFKEYGLSGICIFNLSAQIARSQVLEKNHSYTFVCDLVPNLSKQQLTEILHNRRFDSKETWFYGILHNKLAECVLKQGGTTAESLAHTAKAMKFSFDKLLDFSMSQVTAGGIDEKYLDVKTLTLPNGIVAVGEVLNVDGICGGNNLYFAAASALYLFDEQQRKIALES